MHLQPLWIYTYLQHYKNKSILLIGHPPVIPTKILCGWVLIDYYTQKLWIVGRFGSYLRSSGWILRGSQPCDCQLLSQQHSTSASPSPWRPTRSKPSRRACRLHRTTLPTSQSSNHICLQRSCQLWTISFKMSSWRRTSAGTWSIFSYLYQTQEHVSRPLLD